MISESIRADLEDAAAMLRKLRREGQRVGVVYRERGVDDSPAIQAMPRGSRMVAGCRCDEDAGGWLRIYLTYETEEDARYRPPEWWAQFPSLPTDAPPQQAYIDAVSIAGRALRQCSPPDLADSLPDWALWHYSLLVRNWAGHPHDLWAIHDTIAASLEAITGLIESTTETKVTVPLPDGPRLPNIFRRLGKDYEIKCEPKQWELLSAIWDRELIPLADVCKALGLHRSTDYHNYKSHISKLNTAMIRTGLSWQKVPKQPAISRAESPA